MGRWRWDLWVVALKKNAPLVWGVLVLVGVGLTVVAVRLTVLAQVGGPFEIRSSVIGGGGGQSGGGPFALGGTAGQYDAGTLASGTLVLQGGF